RHTRSKRDWSSDVCSSDLFLEETARRSGAAGAMVHYRLAPRCGFPAAVEDVLGVLDALSVEALLRPGRWVLSGDEAGAGLALAEIGRASCREREWVAAGEG